MEILDYRVVLPALVNIKHEEKTYSIFAYIDHSNKNVIIVDDDGISYNKTELAKLVYDYISSKRNPFTVPPTPKSGFNKLKPETYVNK